VVEHPVQLGRVAAVQSGCDLGDQVRVGEHLVPGEEAPVDVEHLVGQRGDLVGGQRERQGGGAFLG
jgi:hypothetical protein